jgi:putative inorganic carbon (HCO3(-)) transporter
MRGGLRFNLPVARLAGPVVWPPRMRAHEPSPRARPDALLYAIAAMIMSYVWRLQDVVPALAAARPAILLLGVGVIAAVLRPDAASGLRRLRSPILISLALLLALAAAGAPFSLDPAGTASFVVWSLIPTALIAAFTTFGARTLEDIEWIVLATLVGAVGYTLAMYATKPLDEFGRWMPLVHYNPNGLSLLLVALVPPTLYFMRPGERPGRRLFAAACFVLFTSMIARTGSRGGFVGLAVVLLYLLATYRVLPGRLRRWGMLGAVLLLVAGGPRYWERLRTMLEPSRDYNWSGAEYTGRGELWRRGIAYIESRPFVGLGANGFQTAERELSDVARRRAMAGRPVRTLVAHNSYIQVAAELGLAGLALFLALLVHTARTLVGVRRRVGPDTRLGAFAHALLASLLGYAVCALFQSAAYFAFLYLLLGMAAATGALVVAEPRLRARGGLVATVPRPVVPPSARAYGPQSALGSQLSALGGIESREPRAESVPPSGTRRV